MRGKVQLEDPGPRCPPGGWRIVGGHVDAGQDATLQQDAGEHTGGGENGGAVAGERAPGDRREQLGQIDGGAAATGATLSWRRMVVLNALRGSLAPVERLRLVRPVPIQEWGLQNTVAVEGEHAPALDHRLAALLLGFHPQTGAPRGQEAGVQLVAAEVNLRNRHPLNRRSLRSMMSNAVDTSIGAADDRGVAPSAAVVVGVRTHNPYPYGIYPDFLGSLSKRRRGVTLTFPLRAAWQPP